MLLMTIIEFVIAPKGENSPAKDSLMLKSVREFGTFRVRENEYQRMCISWRILGVFIVPFGLGPVWINR